MAKIEEQRKQLKKLWLKRFMLTTGGVIALSFAVLRIFSFQNQLKQYSKFQDQIERKEELQQLDPLLQELQHDPLLNIRELIKGRNFGDIQRVYENLQQALWQTESIYPSSKAIALSEIAAAYGKISDFKSAYKVLNNALNTANEIDDLHLKYPALRAIAATYGELDNTKSNHNVLNKKLHSKYPELRKIAAAYGELSNTKLTRDVLNNAVIDAGILHDPHSQYHALSEVVVASKKLNDPKLTRDVLNNAVTVAKKITDPYSKCHALSEMAVAYEKINDSIIAYKILQNALTRVAKLESVPSTKSKCFGVIATAYGEFNNDKLAHDVLNKAVTLARSAYEPPYAKAEALMEIATAYRELNNDKLAYEFLNKAVDVAGKIDNSTSRDHFLKMLVKNYGRFKDPRVAQEGLKNALTISKKFVYPIPPIHVLHPISSHSLLSSMDRPDVITEISQDYEPKFIKVFLEQTRQPLRNSVDPSITTKNLQWEFLYLLILIVSASIFFLFLFKSRYSLHISLTGQLIIIFPEEYVANLVLLKRQMLDKKRPNWYIQLRMLQETLELISAIYIQIPLDNLGLPSIKRKIDD